jgi:predicted RNA-binding protein YlqC (UPF0109 family)
MADLDNDAAVERAQRLVLNLVRSLLDTPEAVTVQQIQVDGGTRLLVTVKDAERERVIGKKGRTIRSIRVLLASLSARSGHRLTVEVSDPGVETTN